MAPEVDVDWLAEAFPISGASIRNAVVTGAFAAAADGRTIRPKHLVDGLRAEYDKVGKLFPAVAD